MVHGSIEVLVVAARNLKDCEVFGKMDPFIQVRCDSQTKKSRTAYGGGKNPSFNDTIQFNIIEGVNQIVVDAFDEDTVSNDHIGTVTIDLKKAFQTGTDDQWFPLRRPKSGHNAGEVRIVIYFKPRQPKHDNPAPIPAYATNAASNGYPGCALTPMAPAYTPPPPAQYYPVSAPYPPQAVPMPGYPAPQPQPVLGYPPNGYPAYAPPQAVPVPAPYGPTTGYAPQPGYPVYPPQPVPFGAASTYPPPQLGYPGRPY